MSTDAKYMIKNINEHLVGATIVGAISSKYDDDESFGLLVKRDNTEFPVWVDCDAEGNGPGWLSFEGLS